MSKELRDKYYKEVYDARLIFEAMGLRNTYGLDYDARKKQELEYLEAKERLIRAQEKLSILFKIDSSLGLDY